MLLEYQLVPQTIVRPKSFSGLMALYESNYLRLLQLIPELERIDGCYRSRVAGDCDLHVEILERCRYTLTLSLTYIFKDAENGMVSEPDMLIRAYLDGSLAEAMRVTGQRPDGELKRLIGVHAAELDQRWRRNIVLNKWLDYLIHKGHLILER
ncbi:MAG: DUF1249 domain-containing protein [Gammaproteobacteria bacterium]|nr:DUF1249 domain-containing protein [Gammaproteobacteria bacterium]